MGEIKTAPPLTPVLCVRCRSPRAWFAVNDKPLCRQHWDAYRIKSFPLLHDDDIPF
jgi:hypothetical protein